MITRRELISVNEINSHVSHLTHSLLSYVCMTRQISYTLDLLLYPMQITLILLCVYEEYLVPPSKFWVRRSPRSGILNIFRKSSIYILFYIFFPGILCFCDWLFVISTYVWCIYLRCLFLYSFYLPPFLSFTKLPTTPLKINNNKIKDNSDKITAPFSYPLSIHSFPHRITHHPLKKNNNNNTIKDNSTRIVHLAETVFTL